MCMQVKTMAQMQAEGRTPEILFWVGCAGSFDDMAKKITRAFVKILNEVGIDFAVLGSEESCTGDPAKRAGNEFAFQMAAAVNIETLNGYGIKKIVTTCPHCFNTLKNEYPSLGGNYEVIHHAEFLQSLIDCGKLKIEDSALSNEKITYHDPCYLGRANGIYKAPRTLIENLKADLVEMKRCKSKSFCCGAGGAQLFKESEKGDAEINVVRAKEAIETGAKIIATGCPFCQTMLKDGISSQGKDDIRVVDFAELIADAKKL
ncbi:(Fe-S)-binding protein [Ornithobacterium rhinotracheale]